MLQTEEPRITRFDDDPTPDESETQGATFEQPLDLEILAARPAKNLVTTDRPYAYLVEPERTADGSIEDVATIFLTNRECPFRCLMCDLWKNTTDQRVPTGAIPAQIDFAFERLSPAQHIKLYNSGNFFDAQAIPREDWPAIARRVSGMKTVIVENHPKLCSDAVVRFRDLINTSLEVAIGLETAHPRVLAALNKQMTLDDFCRAAEFLRRHDIALRCFVLLRPPFLSEREGIDWALRTIEFAFAYGAKCCAVIPTRAGNGIMDRLSRRGQFSPPTLQSLEFVLETAVTTWRDRRLFADLWNVEQLSECDQCGQRRVDRLRQMNLHQTPFPPIDCDCHGKAVSDG